MSDGVKDLLGFFLFIIFGAFAAPVVLFYIGKWWMYWFN